MPSKTHSGTELFRACLYKVLSLVISVVGARFRSSVLEHVNLHGCSLKTPSHVAGVMDNVTCNVCCMCFFAYNLQRSNECIPLGVGDERCTTPHTHPVSC